MKLSHIFPYRKITLLSPRAPTEIYETLKFESRPYKWFVHPFYDNDGMDLVGDVSETRFSLVRFRHGYFGRDKMGIAQANGTISPTEQGTAVTISFSLRPAIIIAMLIATILVTLMIMIAFVDTTAVLSLFFPLSIIIVLLIHFHIDYKRMLGIFKQLFSATEKEN